MEDALDDPDKLDRLIDPTMLFRFEIDIRSCDAVWSTKGICLDESYRIPTFGSLADRQVFADLRLGWSEKGLAFFLSVRGKKQLPWCRETRLEESDGLRLWIDTRCSPSIHRATKYCQQFAFLPSGTGPGRQRPVATMVNIPRALSTPKPAPPDRLSIRATAKQDGYELSGFIAAQALTGYDPTQQPRVSLHYQVNDREFGLQTLGLADDYPVDSDPALWSEANLIV
ncbi:hypothetical protein SV7mr_20830 [Stieleria bergensis]|uniref:Carbohydrate-binding domain-containing protein n=1 Tax=Stieleria bergensis TaxID=2528025 RepID=A0A517STX4_9BACT|nr:hypothetical protein SV7mr_20830 [Planctomycetes bacterium SV_7m_r]